jgi:hypothetical protein
MVCILEGLMDSFFAARRVFGKRSSIDMPETFILSGIKAILKYPIKR